VASAAASAATLSDHVSGSPADVAVRADRLYRFFHAGPDETLALRGVSMAVEAGEVVAVTGPSGSGKSTLLHCLAGLDVPDGGMVSIAGIALSRRPEAERAAIRGRSIGVLFQSRNLFEHLTVDQNLVVAQRLGGQGGGGPDGARRARRTELLDELGIVHRRHARPAQLSGGEAQRAGLAVALANDPVLVLADEPTGEVDRETGVRILRHLRERAAGGAAVVIVTHDADVAAQADRTVALLDGEVVS
jgi:putative ABC transport system ATP-binding protein